MFQDVLGYDRTQEQQDLGNMWEENWKTLVSGAHGN